jgi:hypothetical protein
MKTSKLIAFYVLIKAYPIIPLSGLSNETGGKVPFKCREQIRPSICFIHIPLQQSLRRNQGFGSGSAWIRINLSCWIRIRIRIQIADPDPDPGGEKITQKKLKKDRIFIFWSAGCSLLRAEGFSCIFGVLYGGLGISKLQFLIKKIKIKFLIVNFFQF